MRTFAIFALLFVGACSSPPTPPPTTPPTASSGGVPAASSAAPTAPATAKPAADDKGAAGALFTVKAINTGKDASLVPGKVTIVDFWATWCEPCKKSFPKLQSLYVKYQASGLEIIGLSEDDDKGGIRAFADQYGAKFPVAWDQDKKLANKYQPKSMPTTLIFDKKGKQRFEHAGYHDGEELEIEKEIKKLLAE